MPLSPQLDGTNRFLNTLAGVLLAFVAVPSVQAQTAYSDTRSSGFVYYQPSDGLKSGLLKSETIEPGNAQLCVTTTYDYDAYGNKASAVVANCAGATGTALFTSRSSTSSFNASGSQSVTVGVGSVAVTLVPGLYAATSTNALTHSETKTAEYKRGQARFIPHAVAPTALPAHLQTFYVLIAHRVRALHAARLSSWAALP
jgi:hypothetical protein